MRDEQVPASFWPFILGLFAGFIGIGLFLSGWGGLAPYPLIAGGVLLLAAALIAFLAGE